MMSKRTKLLMTLGIAAVLAGSGTALAATTDNTTSTQQQQAPVAGKKMMKIPFGGTELQTFLGLTEAELHTAQQEGKTLKQIAEGKGITEAKLIEFLQTQQQKKLDQAVTDGKLTQEQADSMKAGLTTERLQEMINSTGKFGFGGGKGGHGGKGDFIMRAGGEELATFLGLTEEELCTAKQAGKTLAQIAEGKGITQDKLIEFLQTQQQKQLEQAVTDGKITQEQADAMKEKMTAEHLQEMITSTGPIGKGFGGKGHGHGERGFGGFPGAAPGTDGAVAPDASGSTTGAAATPTSLRID
ncbi:hypothetical protein CBW65_00335 [Tumebacillus avium]|uniref:LysM domain-containing protein n=1 Tax=Tumebacillus avium TaxID=1903704 RepID=A0A1Y0IJP8_9BACL|nr:hypothetical protein [Tumebacillus avium]ARU59663.1 hypothetical protein CBW65_00335 [Tumebacillus avium]